MFRSIWIGTVAMVAAAQLLLASRFADAALIASDDFESYSLGEIVGQGTSGSGWGGAYAGDGGTFEVHEVVTGAISGYGQSLAIGRSTGTNTWTRNSVVLRAFDSQNSDNLYVGLVVQGNLATGGTTGDFMQLYVNNLSGASTQSTSYSGGIEGSNFFARKGGEDQVPGTATATSGTIYQVVLAFSKSNPGVGNNYDSVAVYIDQPTETSADVSLGPADAGTVSLADMSFLHFRLSALEGGDRFYVDNLRVATTYTEAIPEPSSMILIGLALTMGMARFRKRR